MVLKAEVIEAFAALGLTPDASYAEASKEYKKLALKHHPDRNFGDLTASARFQEIGRAWTVCQKHIEHPLSSEIPDPKAKRQPHFNEAYSGKSYSWDDDVPLDEEEMNQFFRFMFEEMLFNRFSHSKGQRYRSQRRGDFGGGVYTFSEGLAESQKRQESNNERQRKENEAYAQRVRDFERECAEEEAEIKRRAKEEEAKAKRLALAYNRAFELARSGKGIELRQLVEDFKLDIKRPVSSKATQRDAKSGNQIYETLFHLVAGFCDVATVEFVISKGADLSALNTSRLTPFQFAISRGNFAVVEYFLSHANRNTNVCHPSKAADDKHKSTPLRLAIGSANVPLIRHLLKHATVHDVTRCWTQVREKKGENWSEICDVLLEKYGFEPPDNAAKEKLVSEKDLRKAKQLEVDKKAAALKAQRAAEAEENRLRKLAAKAERERELLERQAQQAAEEGKRRAEELVKARRKEEAALAERTRKAEEKERARAEERARKEAEARSRKELEARKKEAEEKLKREAAREQARRDREAKEAWLAEEKRVREQEARDAEERRARARQIEAARQAQLEAERQKAERLTRERAEERVRQPKAKATQVGKAQDQSEQEAEKRRRREQSARDKARHQQLREDRKLAQVLASANIPLPPPLHQASTLQTTTNYTRYAQGPLSPPISPFSLQTVAVPDDLFRFDPLPRPYTQAPPTPESTPSVESRPRAPRRGRGGKGAGASTRESRPVAAAATAGSNDSSRVGNKGPCFFFQRGRCTKGDSCPFSHAQLPPGTKVKPPGSARVPRRVPVSA